MRPLYGLGHLFFNLLFRGMYRYQAHHPERVPRTGACILAPNHVSYLDPPLVGSGLPREIYYVARSTLFRNPLFAWLIASVNAIPIIRGDGPNQDWDKFLAVLKRGEPLLIFPEGTRSPDGQLQRGKTGFARLVYWSKAPVHPVYIEGTFEAMPKQGRLSRHPIRIIYGAALPLDDLFSQEGDKRVLRAITDRTMDAILGLKAELAGIPRS